MQDYLIGVDAGGTKTTAQAYSLQGEPLAAETGGFGNLTVHFEQGFANLCETIDRLKTKLEGNCVFLCIGCAGIETGGKKEEAARLIRERYPEPAVMTNDAMLGLYAALEGRDGLLVIAGTGSIGYLKQGGELRRFGGWGHLINDDGSGYTIAAKAIRFIAYGFDTNHSETLLKQKVFAHLGIQELRELIDFTYRSSKGELAALTPIVEQAAEEGDPQAGEILDWAGERIAYLAIGLCRQYGVENPEIAISGSVIRKTARVNKKFRETLLREIGSFTLHERRFEPTIGAYYLYLEQQNQAGE